jgi:hypothetical protein
MLNRLPCPFCLPGQILHAALISLLWAFLSASLSAQAPIKKGAGGPPQRVKTKSTKVVVARELKLVDSKGRLRLLLTTDQDQPLVRMLRSDGKPAIDVVLDDGGHPSVQLRNPDGGASVTLEIDDKGTHLKLDHPGGASTYLFMNDAGVSGLVFEDQNGKRRYEILREVDADTTVRRFDAEGKPLP